MFNLSKLFQRHVPVHPIKPVVLLILDGWGIAPESRGNAIAQAKIPNINFLKANYPSGELIASGESVGLPANEVGNTEVGHLTMGAGRVIFQDLKKINTSITNADFFENKAFLDAVDHIRKNNSKLHIIGLAGSGNVHSSLEHLYALVQFCNSQRIKDACFHLFTDGRDSPPKEALTLFADIESRITQAGIGKIASITGRYYAMDRDGRWERIQKTYSALVEGQGNSAQSVSEAINQAYAKNLTDEFIEPTLIVGSGGASTISDNDAIIFYNFRVDRPRELTLAIVSPEFENLKSFQFGYVSDSDRVGKKVKAATSTFKRNKIVKNAFFVTMTEYQKDIPVSEVAFPPEIVLDPLGYVLSQNNMVQMRMSESEKEKFVTYYFNGLHEESYPGEERKIIPSPKVSTYDKRPQMSVFKLVSEFYKFVSQGKYHFFVINFANPDMVAHTGNIPATLKALNATDKAVGEIARMVLEAQGALFITADHGNAEELITFPTQSFFFTTEKGSTNTDHSNNPVPLLLVRQDLFQKGIKLPKGALCDIAPTILGIMKIAKPADMTGRDLVKEAGIV